MARSSVKIGIIMLIAWVIPVVGVVLAVVGLILGAMDRSGTRPDLARAGIFMNSLGLFLAVINISVSLYLFMSGAIDPFTILNQLN
jgi:hypothetical protein